MKTKRPIGMIRPLATMFGRVRRRWRGGPLVPMIWRRHLRAAPAPAQKTARPAPSAPAQVFNLTLVWPAGTAARAGPMRRFETRTREVFHAGRNAGPGGTNRLTTLVERLWLRSDKSSPARATVSPATIARQPVRGDGTQAGSVARSRQGGDPAPPAEAAPRVWPRANISESRAADARVAGASHLQPRAPRAPAIGHRKEARASKPADRIGRAASRMFPARAPAAMAWRGAPLSGEAPAAEASRPARPRAALVWRSGIESGFSPAPSPMPTYGRRPSADLVWRRPAAGADHGETGTPHRAPAATLNDSATRADRPVAVAPPAPAAPSAAAIQPAEMSRLVDEVVRRLDRIGRDERMRRGI